jgi:mycothiol system anti-sigma-R factor
MGHDPCDKCEELLHGYLDRELSDVELKAAESHLDTCGYCRRRYRFEESLRKYIRLSCSERMPVGLMDKLSQLRSTDGPTAL